MSGKTRYPYAELVEHLCAMLGEASIGEAVYPMNRPTALPMQLSCFVVVSFPQFVTDRGAIQKADVNVELFCRNKANGLQDVVHLNEMLQSLLELFPYVYGRFSLTRPRIQYKGDDGTGFGVWLVEIDVTTNMTDQYKLNSKL